MRRFLGEDHRFQRPAFSESKKLFRLGPHPLRIDISDYHQKDVIWKIPPAIILQDIRMGELVKHAANANDRISAGVNLEGCPENKIT